MKHEMIEAFVKQWLSSTSEDASIEIRKDLRKLWADGYADGRAGADEEPTP